MSMPSRDLGHFCPGHFSGCRQESIGCDVSALGWFKVATIVHRSRSTKQGTGIDSVKFQVMLYEKVRL